jgi:hypothetical protein
MSTGPTTFRSSLPSRVMSSGSSPMGRTSGSAVFSPWVPRGAGMVLDDSTPRAIADEEGLAVTVTVQLLCDAIRAGMLTVPMTEQLADELIMGKYYLPFGRGGFRLFALQQGLIDY